MTVPAGKKFVILKLITAFAHDEVLEYKRLWQLTIDDVFFIDGKINDAMPQDFPDRCVVVDEGKTLKFVWPVGYPTKTAYLTVVGYYYDI